MTLVQPGVAFRYQRYNDSVGDSFVIFFRAQETTMVKKRNLFANLTGAFGTSVFLPSVAIVEDSPVNYSTVFCFFPLNFDVIYLYRIGKKHQALNSSHKNRNPKMIFFKYGFVPWRCPG